MRLAVGGSFSRWDFVYILQRKYLFLDCGFDVPDVEDTGRAGAPRLGIRIDGCPFSTYAQRSTAGLLVQTLAVSGD